MYKTISNTAKGGTDYTADFSIPIYENEYSNDCEDDIPSGLTLPIEVAVRISR